MKVSTGNIIAHVDMDAFFASVEQADDPSLKGRCVIVGGLSGRGVVSAASYEARKFGVRSAMPMSRAKKLCPHGIFITPRHERYKEVSSAVMGVLHDFTPLVEQVSIDEAYLDLTGCTYAYRSVEDMARKIKDAVFETSSVTCSIGIAPLKFLAKIASGMQKPDGMTIITPESAGEFIARLPVEKIPGVGPKTASRLLVSGIQTMEDVKNRGMDDLRRILGKPGIRLYELASGIDRSRVTPLHQVKSVSSEKTLDADTTNLDCLLGLLLEHAQEVAASLRREGKKAKTVFIKIRHDNFVTVTRQAAVLPPSDTASRLYSIAKGLLRSYGIRRPVRLIGLGAADLVGAREPRETYLFDAADETEAKWGKVERAIDRIEERFGKGVVKHAGSLAPGATPPKGG